MANLPGAPQDFTFGGQRLQGFLLSFNGSTPRRRVIHEFPKRAGAVVEDMARAPRKLEARLVFTTEYARSSDGAVTIAASAASLYQGFLAFVDANPRGLLVHPIAGQWNAFCEGPSEDIDFARSIDAVSVRVSWIEADLGAPIPADAPGVALAAQDVTAQQSIFRAGMAEFMGDLAKVDSLRESSRAELESALANVSLVEAPIDLIRDTVNDLEGLNSEVKGKINAIATHAALLNDDVTAFMGASTDVWSGTPPSASQAFSVATLLGIVLQDSAVLEAALIDASTTPAGAADAVGQAHELVATCLVLDAAVKASRPPSILVVVPTTMDLITFCVRVRKYAEPLARATDILGMNRISNPAMIAGGTKLYCPAR